MVIRTLIAPGDEVAGFAYATRRSESSLSRRRVWVYSSVMKFPCSILKSLFYKNFFKGVLCRERLFTRAGSVIGCSAKRQQESPSVLDVLALLCLYITLPRGSYQEYRGINNRFLFLYCNSQFYCFQSHFKRILHVYRYLCFLVA